MIDVSRAIHIDEILGGWLLRREDAEPIATYRERDEAVRVAAGMARAAGGGTIVIRSRDGSVGTLAVAEGSTDEPQELAELEDLDEVVEAERRPDAVEAIEPRENDHVRDGGAAPSDLQMGDAQESGL